MKGLSSKQITDLNRDDGYGGTFFEAIIVARTAPNTDPPVLDYFAKFERTFSFEGNLYQPLPMEWEGMATSSQMTIPTNNIVISDIGGVVADYLHDPDIQISVNDIIMRILHMSSKGVVSLYDEDLLQIQVVRASIGQGQVTIFAGLDLRFSEQVPKETIETNEFPGIRQDSVRIGT